MPKKKIAFVVTKPLQLMVSLCLIRDRSDYDSDITIYITNSFLDARQVTLRASDNSPSHLSFEFLECKKFFYKKIINNKYSEAFLDSDVGFKTFLHLLVLKIFNPFLKINIYEEGYGTYSKNLYTGLRKWLLKFIFLNTSYGNNFLTSKVYLFNPPKYVKEIGESKKIIEIKTTIWNLIQENYEYLDFVFDTSKLKDLKATSASCGIYLTSWDVDRGFIDKLSKIKGDLYIKPHPHIDKKISFENFFVFNGAAPFELIIFKLLGVYETIRVYDHGSAARLYVDNPRVVFYSIDSAAFKEEFYGAK